MLISREHVERGERSSSYTLTATVRGIFPLSVPRAIARIAFSFRRSAVSAKRLFNEPAAHVRIRKCVQINKTRSHCIFVTLVTPIEGHGSSYFPKTGRCTFFVSTRTCVSPPNRCDGIDIDSSRRIRMGATTNPGTEIDLVTRLVVRFPAKTLRRNNKPRDKYYH